MFNLRVLLWRRYVLSVVVFVVMVLFDVFGVRCAVVIVVWFDCALFVALISRCS